MQLLKTAFPQGRVYPSVPLFLSAVLEYLAVEMLELASNKAHDRKIARASRSGESRSYRITLEDLLHGIYSDDELKILVDTVFKKI
ncbi:hypothetical protein AVEN_104938-1 [Araneus ventricosus]|uniref:Histone H2A n=1 Tax=Araneus ventricosus TaxID=182803 RepID=A0A4Y2SRV3_ARAVE|nr:hypothetical protein AVEN_104938-1 [Araneus ventricosus]